MSPRSMTAREHFELAEERLRCAGEDHESVMELHAEALVHATLAVAAATIDLAEATQVLSEQGPGVIA